MRTLLTILLCALVLWRAAAAADDLLSHEQFRDAAIALIQEEAPDAEIEVRDALGVTVRRPRNKEIPEFNVNFDNAYREYQANPGALMEILHRWVRFATQPPEQAQMRERVVSVLRSRENAAAYAAVIAQGEQPGTLVSRPFAGDLVEVLVFDGAETIQYASVESLAEIGLTPEQAWALAPENLPSRIGELELGGVEGADRLVYVTGGNGLAPSSLLDGRLCAGGARYMFLIVERNGYVMADASDSVAERQFRDILRDVRRDGATLSLTPLGCRDGRVAAIALTD